MASRNENSVRYKAAKSPQQPATRSNYLPNQTATRGDEQFIVGQNKGTRSEFEDRSLSSDLVEQSFEVVREENQPPVHKENEECVYQLAYEGLEEVSRQIGRELKMRYQNILPLKTLRDIATKLPTTEAEMLEIDEVTKVIYDRFGQRYLKVTTKYKQILEEQRRMQNEVGLFDDLDDENGDYNEAIDSDVIQPADRPSTSGVRRADCSRGEKRRSGGSGGCKESSECSFVVSTERSSESSDFEVDIETDDIEMDDIEMDDIETDDAVRSEYWLRSKAAEERPNEDEGQCGRSSRNSSNTDLQDEAVDVLNPSKIYRMRSDEVEVQITTLAAGQKSECAAACKKLVDQLIRKITNE